MPEHVTWILVRHDGDLGDDDIDFWTGASWSAEFPDAEHWTTPETRSVAAFDLLRHLKERDGGVIYFSDVEGW